jgi:hypothetical protein
MHSFLASVIVWLMTVFQSLVVLGVNPLSKPLCYEGKIAILCCCVGWQVYSLSLTLISCRLTYSHKFSVSCSCFAVEKPLMIYHCDIFSELMKPVYKFVRVSEA